MNQFWSRDIGFRKGTNNQELHIQTTLSPFNVLASGTRSCLLVATSQTIVRIFVCGLSQGQRHIVKKSVPLREFENLQKEPKNLSQILWIRLLVWVKYVLIV